MVPASAGLMFLAKPIVLTLFQGGRFDAYSSEMTAKALFFYSIGLFAYGSTKILQSSFFALKDTLTPTKISFVALISNVLLNLILMFPLKLGGLALATSLSGIFNFFALFYILNKKVGKLKVAPLLLSLLKISLCAIGMGLVSHFIAANLSYSGNMLQRLINIAIPIICGIFSYFIFCVVLRVKETKDFIKWLKTIALSKKK
jgi:putative peptidoglycan lipid II flippase